MLAKIKNYFFTGILVTAPVVITFWIVISLVKIFDRLITPLLPLYLNPNTYLPRDVPGLGLIFLVVFLIFIGFIAANFFGSFLNFFECSSQTSPPLLFEQVALFYYLKR